MRALCETSDNFIVELRSLLLHNEIWSSSFWWLFSDALLERCVCSRALNRHAVWLRLCVEAIYQIRILRAFLPVKETTDAFASMCDVELTRFRNVKKTPLTVCPVMRHYSTTFTIFPAMLAKFVDWCVITDRTFDRPIAWVSDEVVEDSRLLRLFVINLRNVRQKILILQSQVIFRIWKIFHNVLSRDEAFYFVFCLDAILYFQWWRSWMCGCLYICVNRRSKNFSHLGQIVERTLCLKELCVNVFLLSKWLLDFFLELCKLILEVEVEVRELSWYLELNSRNVWHHWVYSCLIIVYLNTLLKRHVGASSCMASKYLVVRLVWCLPPVGKNSASHTCEIRVDRGLVNIFHFYRLSNVSQAVASKVLGSLLCISVELLAANYQLTRDYFI